MTPDGVSPPGTYPVVVIGSGPGALQLSASLTGSGVQHAVLSRDDAPGGMFRRYPLFQRLITWTKPYAPAERRSRAYERYDWNSLIDEDVERRSLVADTMDGTSYFPSRAEMELGLANFAAPIAIRYRCTWESTRREDDTIVVVTSDGEYRTRALVVAVGMTQPWKPQIPGLENVPHYVDAQPARAYAGKRVCVIGKRNSGFEIADALLPWARRIVLVSPRPARISVVAHSTAAARARYLQPYEDHVLGGGHVILDATVDEVERGADGWRVHTSGTTRPGSLIVDADEVIAATGFTTPLADLGSSLGVATFMQGRLPVQTAMWESPGAPGVYFAGSITQGAIGLKKYGIPSNSAAVHGFRYNARVLAAHLAAISGRRVDPVLLDARDVVGYLAAEATDAPELWNQQSYLARVVTFGEGPIIDEGIWPLQRFVDESGPDAAAITIETDAAGEIHPALYVRRAGAVREHLLPPDPLHDFQTSEHRRILAEQLRPWVSG
jgi:thioredoxin reductase